MADIDVEKRKKKPVWPWVIGLLLVIGLIWAIAEFTGDEAEEPAEQELVPVDSFLIGDTVEVTEEDTTVLDQRFYE